MEADFRKLLQVFSSMNIDFRGGIRKAGFAVEIPRIAISQNEWESDTEALAWLDVDFAWICNNSPSLTTSSAVERNISSCHFKLSSPT